MMRCRCLSKPSGSSPIAEYAVTHTLPPAPHNLTFDSDLRKCVSNGRSRAVVKEMQENLSLLPRAWCCSSSQLQQQRSLLAAATSDQDRKRISERIQSLTRLWKRKQGKKPRLAL